MKVKIKPSPVQGVVAAPPSKSYTHRAVILGSLAPGETTIKNFLTSEDTGYTIEACRRLGIAIIENESTLVIRGGGGHFHVKPGQETIYVGNSGSTMRMTAMLAALAPGRVVLDGEPRLRERPAGDLLAALNRLGVQARSLNNNGCPPLEIIGGSLRGGEIPVSGEASSQHISALLMVAPYARGPLTLHVVDHLHSRPYVDITIDIMARFGVRVEKRDYSAFTVNSGQHYRGLNYTVEGDYSSAAYFLAAGALGGGPITVTNLKKDSAQGDRYFFTILAEMGSRVSYKDDSIEVVSGGNQLRGVSVDMGDYPDIVQPLAAVAAFARGQTRITNIGHLKLKETDRINHTAAELRKMGVAVAVSDEAITITGGAPRGAVIDSHNDHRMVMSLAVAALYARGDTIIEGAEAVGKSYPGFFSDLARLGARIEEIR